MYNSNVQKIILPPVGSELYNDTNLEPQFIQSRSNNTANIHIHSDDAKLELNKVNMLLSSVKNIKESPKSLAQGIKRLQVYGIGLSYMSPNVNERNNTVTFYSQTSGLNHTVQLQEGFYDDPTVLMQEIINQMNTVSGASGLTFSFFPIGLSGGLRFEIAPAVGLFYFVNTCTAVTKGNPCYGFQIEPSQPSPQRVKTVGPVFLTYTRWIDICSNRLNAYTRLPDSSTGLNSNIVYRLYLPIDEIKKPTIVPIDNYEATSKNWLFSDSLSVLDFQLRDEWNDLLYVPTYFNNFSWWMRIIVEM